MLKSPPCENLYKPQASIRKAVSRDIADFVRFSVIYTWGSLGELIWL
jgi:hypothetical protein